MKYQKDFKKVSFGFGNETAAGKGDLSQTIVDDNKKVDDKTFIIIGVIQFVLAAIGLMFRAKHKSDKKGKKNKKKR